jgi:hypothetical protein
MPETLPAAALDDVQIMHVLPDPLDNSIRYYSPFTPITGTNRAYSTGAQEIMSGTRKRLQCALTVITSGSWFVATKRALLMSATSTQTRALAGLAALLATAAPAAAATPFIVYQCGQDSSNMCRVQLDGRDQMSLTTDGRRPSAAWGGSRDGPAEVPLPPPAEQVPPPGNAPESDAVALALATAADMLQVPVEQLTVVTVEAREWSDTSLGCAAPEQAYLEIIVSGYLVVVASANGQDLQIHTDQGQYAVSC